MHRKMVPGFCTKLPWAGQPMPALLLMAGGGQKGWRLVRGSGRSHCCLDDTEGGLQQLGRSINRFKFKRWTPNMITAGQGKAAEVEKSRKQPKGK